MVLAKIIKQEEDTYTTSVAVKVGEYHSKTMHYQC